MHSWWGWFLKALNTIFICNWPTQVRKTQSRKSKFDQQRPNCTFYSISFTFYKSCYADHPWLLFPLYAFDNYTPYKYDTNFWSIEQIAMGFVCFHTKRDGKSKSNSGWRECLPSSFPHIISSGYQVSVAFHQTLVLWMVWCLWNVQRNVSDQGSMSVINNPCHWSIIHLGQWSIIQSHYLHNSLVTFGLLKSVLITGIPTFSVTDIDEPFFLGYIYTCT